MSPKCSIVENDGELMLMAFHTIFLPQHQYSRVYAHEDASFFHLFYKITNIWIWRCFSSSKVRKQFSHTFCNITMIFKRMSQYFPALFKRIYTTILVLRKDKTNYLSNQTWAKCCHSRNKKTLDGGPNTSWKKIFKFFKKHSLKNSLFRVLSWRIFFYLFNSFPS